MNKKEINSLLLRERILSDLLFRWLGEHDHIELRNTTMKALDTIQAIKEDVKMNINDAKLFVDILEYSTYKELQSLHKDARERSNDFAINVSTRAVWKDFDALIKKQLAKF